MSSAAPVENPPPSGSSKKKNNKKKKAKNKPAEVTQDAPVPDGGELLDEPETLVKTAAPSDVTREAKANGDANKERNGKGDDGDQSEVDPPVPNGEPSRPPTSSSDSSEKLDSIISERDALREEVEALKKELQASSSQGPDDDVISRLKTELEESEAAKEHAETQYQNLLERVEKIKSTLGERLKRDKAELEETRERIEELEAENEQLQNGATGGAEEVEKLKEELHEANRELGTLRSRSNLSQQNWLKEKEDLTKQMQHFRSELESTSSAMGEWEVIAMEERSQRESLTDKVGDYEEQLSSIREAYERAASERASQSHTIDGLQRALQELQDARKRELREMVESSEEQLQAMRTQVQEVESRSTAAEEARESLAKELERTVPFEKEVKEKNLLIGKLRHEAIVLNDHLTKALRYIKKNRPEESIDRQVVTNHFLQFLALDRSDPKKFQILQVIAGLLNWTDSQREQAGLARPGTSSTLRLPPNPFHRTPSTPSLNTEFFSEAPSGGKESLAELWAGFLERSVEDPSGEATGRKDSVSSAATSPVPGRPDTRGGA